jgi:hypothetical protein
MKDERPVPQIKPVVALTETNVIIILPAVGTNTNGFTAIGEQVAKAFRESISGLLHDRIMEALLKAEVEARSSCGQMTVNEYIRNLEG